MASLFHMYDRVRAEPGAEAAAAAAKASREARAARVAAAAAAAREEAAVLCNYMPLVREALRDAGVPYDEGALDPSSPQNAAPPRAQDVADAAADADEDDDFVYDVYCLDPEDCGPDGDSLAGGGDGGDSSAPAVTVRVFEPPDGDTWFVSEPAGAAGGGWAGGGSSDEDGAEVDYPEDEDSDPRDDLDGTGSDSDGSGGAAFMRAAASRWRRPGADSSDDEEGGESGARKGRRGLRDPYASDDEEYDTVAYDAAQDEDDAWAPRR